MSSETKQAIVEQVFGELTGELFTAFFTGIEEQQELTPEQQQALGKYIGGAIDLRDKLADFIFAWEAVCERIRAEEKRKANMRHKIEARLRGLRDSIATQMQSWCDPETQQAVVLKRIVGRAAMFILKESKPTVEIENLQQIPEEYLRYEPVPDKVAIQNALVDGKVVPGARLVPGKFYVEIR